MMASNKRRLPFRAQEANVRAQQATFAAWRMAATAMVSALPGRASAAGLYMGAARERDTCIGNTNLFAASRYRSSKNSVQRIRSHVPRVARWGREQWEIRCGGGPARFPIYSPSSVSAPVHASLHQVAMHPCSPAPWHRCILMHPAWASVQASSC